MPRRCCSATATRSTPRCLRRRKHVVRRSCATAWRAPRASGARGIGRRPRGDQAARRHRLGPRVPRSDVGRGVAAAVNPRMPAAEWQYILDEAGFSVILAESRERHAGAVARTRAAAGRIPARAVAGEPSHRSRWTWRHPRSGAIRRAQRASPRRSCMRTVLRCTSSRCSRRAGRSRRRPTVRQLEAVLLLPADEQSVCRPEARRDGDPRPAVADRGQRLADRRGAAPDGAVQRAVAVPQPAARRARAGAHRRRPACGCACRPARRCRAACATSGAADGAAHRQRLWRIGDVDPGDARLAATATASCRRPASKSAALSAAPAAPPTRLAIARRRSRWATWTARRPQAESFPRRRVLPGRSVRAQRAGAGASPGARIRWSRSAAAGSTWSNSRNTSSRPARHGRGGGGVRCPTATASTRWHSSSSPADAPRKPIAALGACADTLPHYQRPRWLHAVPALPRTATGKLLRRKLRELHRALDADPSGSAGAGA